MLIKKLNMCGFKCFVRLTQIKFDRCLNIITGDNGTGKSTILEALKFILDSDYAASETVDFLKSTSANSNIAYVQIVVEDCPILNMTTKIITIERNFASLDIIKMNKTKISINDFHSELKKLMFMTKPTSIITPFVLEQISKSNLWNFLIHLLQNKIEIFEHITEIKRSSENTLKQFQNDFEMVSTNIEYMVESMSDYNKYAPLSKELNSLNYAWHEINRKILEEEIHNTTNELNIFQNKHFDDMEQYRSIKQKIYKLKLLTKHINIFVFDIIYNKIQNLTELSLKCYNDLCLHINRKETVDFIEKLFENIQNYKSKINTEEIKIEELKSEFDEIAMKKNEIDLYFQMNKDYMYIEALLTYKKENELQELIETDEKQIKMLEETIETIHSELNTTKRDYDDLKQNLTALENDDTDDLEYLVSLDMSFSLNEEYDDNVEKFFALAHENDNLYIEQFKIQSEISLDKEVFQGLKSIHLIMNIYSNDSDVELPADFCEPIFNLIDFKSSHFANAIMPFILEKLPILVTRNQSIANNLLSIFKTANLEGVVSIMSLDNFYVPKTTVMAKNLQNIIPLTDIFEFNIEYMSILESIFGETVYLKNRNNIKNILKRKDCCIVDEESGEFIYKNGVITSNPIVNKNKYENCIKNLRIYYNNLKKMNGKCNEQLLILNNIYQERTSASDQTPVQLDYIYARRTFRQNNELQRQIRWNIFNTKIKINYLNENLIKNENNLVYINNKLQYTRERISNNIDKYDSDKNKYQLNYIEDIYKKYFQKLMNKNLILIKLKYFMSEIDENEYKIHANLLTLNIYEGNKILFDEKYNIYHQYYTDIESLKQKSFDRMNEVNVYTYVEQINNATDFLLNAQHELFDLTKKCNYLNGKKYNLLKQFHNLFNDNDYKNFGLTNRNHEIEENISLAEVESKIIALKTEINYIGPVISEGQFLKYSMIICKHKRFSTKVKKNIVEKELEDNLTERIVIMHDKLLIKKIRLLLPKLKKNLSNFLTPYEKRKFQLKIETNGIDNDLNENNDNFLNNYLNINDIINIHIFKMDDATESMDKFSFTNKCLAVLALLLSTINEIDNFLFMFDDLDNILKQPILWDIFNAIILDNQNKNNLQVFLTTKNFDSIPVNTNIIKCYLEAGGLYVVKQYYKE